MSFSEAVKFWIAAQVATFVYGLVALALAYVAIGLAVLVFTTRDVFWPGKKKPPR